MTRPEPKHLVRALASPEVAELPLARLKLAEQLRDRAQEIADAALLEAHHDHAMNVTDIGAALGISRQAAHQRVQHAQRRHDQRGGGS
jgi:transcriptional regulator of acetoin/glycerol metabolism